MNRDDDRELRRRADREAERLLFEHREQHQPPPGAADRAWTALQGRIAAGEAAPLELPAAARGGVGRRVVVGVLAAAAVLALWQWRPREALRGGQAGALAAIFTRVDPDGSRRAAWGVPKDRLPPASGPEVRREAGPEDRSTAVAPGGDAGASAGTAGETLGGAAGEAVAEVDEVNEAAAETIGEVVGETAGARRAVPKDRPAGDLAEQLAQVRAAGAAVRAGRGDEGLAAADAYLQAHPSGVFAPEARLHRAEALCLLGRVDAAREAAAAFVRELPDSPLRARMARVCAASE